MLNAAVSQVSVTVLFATLILRATASSSLHIITQPTVHDLNVTETTCTGSIWCPKFNFASNRINLYLQDWIKYTMSDWDVYGPGVQIACATVTILLPPLGTNAYCVYTKGTHVPAAGINGSVIKQKMDELQIHRCFACGETAIADSGNLSEEGVFVIDYVPRNRVRCGRVGDVVCPPTVPSAERAGLEQGSRPELSSFNATFNDGEVTLQALSIQDP